MISISSRFQFGKAYEEYMARPKEKTVDKVEAPRRFNGCIRADWDDIEGEVMEEYRDVSGMQRIPAD